MPGSPRTTHAVADPSALHEADPIAGPDDVTATFATGPPVADMTLSLMAIGAGQGGGMQSGSLW